MRSTSSAVLLLIVAGLVACEDSGRRRPGGSSPNTNTPGTNTPGTDARVAVEGEDAGEPPVFPDAFTPPPPDAGFIDAGFPGAPDAFVPAPDAFVPPPPAPDGGVVGSDAGVSSSDAGPPIRTHATAVPGTAVAHLGGSAADLTFTLAFDNPGPSDETLTITRADIVVALAIQAFDVVPLTFVAPVGHSERTFIGTPSTTGATRALIALFCSGLLGVPSAGGLYVDISEYQEVIMLPSVTCSP